MKQKNETKIEIGKHYHLSTLSKCCYTFGYLVGLIVMTPFLLGMMLLVSAVMLLVCALMCGLVLLLPLIGPYVAFLEVWSPPEIEVPSGQILAGCE